jgi:hypothetical protein
MTLLKLRPAYHQFYVLDEAECAPYPEDICDADIQRGVKAAPFILAIYTTTEDEIDVALESPATSAVNTEDWEHIVEGPLDVPSGKLLVATPESYLPECPTIPVAPGAYRVVVCARGLAEGRRQEYVLKFLPSPLGEPRVIKNGRASAA